MRILAAFVVLALLGLTACAAPGSRVEPTPTIVRLDPAALTRAADSSATAAAGVTPASTPTPETGLEQAGGARAADVEAAPAAGAAPASHSTLEEETPAAEAEPAAGPGPTSAIARAEVVSAGLNIRQGPGMDYASIGVAAQGDVFDITGVSPNGAWLQIVTAGGAPGWISSRPAYTRVLGSLDSFSPAGAQATALPAPAASPALANSAPAAGGGRLVFSTGSGGDLYAVNADGTGLQKLAGGVIDPVVSPDGAQVAFTRWDGAGFGALYVMNLDGSGERVVLNETRQAKSPAWSADGRNIIVSFQHGGLRDPKEECKTFDSDDGIRIPRGVQITSSSFNGATGEFRICFIRQEDLQWSLRQVNVETGEFEDLPVDLYSYSPALDPQNPWRLVYQSEGGLMQLDLNTGEQQPLTGDLRDTGPVFSPDGTKLALTYRQHDHWEVYTYDLGSGSRQRLTKPPILADPQYNSAAPAWSPDGSQIAFVTDRRGRWEIWLMNADGSNPHPLLSPAASPEIEYWGMNERLLNWIP